MPESSDVSAGEQATAVQHNNLRADVLDITLGHDHGGGAGEGKKIATADLTGHDKTAHDALGINADTVDTFHWTAMKWVSATMLIGNKDTILATGERAICYIPYNMTLREIHVREVGEISGSATLNLYLYDGTADMTEALIVACSLSSQNYRIITGRSDSLQAHDWIALFCTGTPTSVKRIAVALRLERAA
jgi:hypothetical protein